MNVDGFEREAARQLVRGGRRHGGDADLSAVCSRAKVPQLPDRRRSSLRHADRPACGRQGGPVGERAERPAGRVRAARVADVGSLHAHRAKGMLRIVDEHRGGWGHISIDQVVQSDRKRMAEPARWEIAVNKRYLWLTRSRPAPAAADAVLRRRPGRSRVRDRTDPGPHRLPRHGRRPAFRGKPLVIESQRGATARCRRSNSTTNCRPRTRLYPSRSARSSTSPPAAAG